MPASKGFQSVYNRMISTFGRANHRGRDVLVRKGDPFWIHAKFAFGLNDADLKGEEVWLYLCDNQSQTWSPLGSATTTRDHEHPTVENVQDSGGRIYVQAEERLSETLTWGKNRVKLVVAGDHSSTELDIQVIPDTTRVVVTDIDGTLTESEIAAATEVLGRQPAAHPGAAELMQEFHQRGYAIFYLTARAEWMMYYTRAWLRDKGFPTGTIHTTVAKFGASGNAAGDFKIGELAQLHAQTGLVPTYAFGNKGSDVRAFRAAGIAPQKSYYFKLQESAQGGVIHENYRDLARKIFALEERDPLFAQMRSAL